MPDAAVEDGLSLLQLSPAERDERDVDPAAVQDALRNVIEHGSRDEKQLADCQLPALDFDYRVLDADNRHPVVFEDCEIEAFSAADADFRVPFRFESSEIGDLTLDGATVETDFAVRESTITGEVSGAEARFERDADWAGTTFEAPVSMPEAWFGDDTRFTDVVFEAEVDFRGVSFHGMSNELDDNADFEGASFESDARFRQAAFEYATFENGRFEGIAGFEEVSFAGDVDFSGVEFVGEADFDESEFGEDASFAEALFQAPAVFRGAVFEGGARTMEDDATFADASFAGPANFRSAQFRYVTFDAASFADHSMFEEARFDGDADFIDTVFSGETDFDEARFDGDADFTGSRFEAPAVFRGAAFEGEAKHLEKNAVFDDVEFGEEADFDNATFTTASFNNSRFGGVCDFSGATFEDVEFHVEATDTDTLVDFTHAVLKQGAITQPADAWVRYDLTHASLGDVALTTDEPGGRHELLGYFRFCNTEFNEFDGYEFDFSAHTYYFDRNDWNLHSFDEPPGNREYDAEMSPANIETTYLKAKNAASAGGYVKAAGEFRVQRQRYARRKHAAIARDQGTDLGGRISSASRALENLFLDVTCGYGMRLGRILVVFLVAPIVPALLYAFGGPMFKTGAGQLSSISQLATPTGQAIMYKNLHFSYITFLTIGYGGIGPQGALARLMAGLEVYVSIILGGLVLYALIKRSEL